MMVEDTERFTQVLAMATQFVPHVVLLGVVRLCGEGVDTVASLRREPSLAALPILALTATELDPDAHELLAAGFDGVLAKPLTPRRLREFLQKHLSPTRASSPASFPGV